MFLHRHRLFIPAVAVVCFTTVIADSESANMGGVRWDDSGFISPAHGQPTKLEIEKETLVFNCKTTGNQVICEFEATARCCAAVRFLPRSCRGRLKENAVLRARPDFLLMLIRRWDK